MQAMDVCLCHHKRLIFFTDFAFVCNEENALDSN